MPQRGSEHTLGSSTSGRFRSRKTCDVYVRAWVARRATHVAALATASVAVVAERVRRWVAHMSVCPVYAVCLYVCMDRDWPTSARDIVALHLHCPHHRSITGHVRVWKGNARHVTIGRRPEQGGGGENVLHASRKAPHSWELP